VKLFEQKRKFKQALICLIDVLLSMTVHSL